MKQEYDFSKTKHGKCYRTIAKLNLPVYLDDAIRNYLLNKAKGKGVDLNEIVNDLLRKAIASLEEMK